MGNLKVADSEYEDLKSKYEEISNLAEEQLKTYFQCMNRILSSSLTSGIVYNNLLDFVTEAEKIQGVFKDISKDLCNKCDTFVEEIDKADEYLY